MAFGARVNLFFASVLSVTLFHVLGALGAIGTFGLYAGLNVVACVLIFLLVSETKLLTLEELDQ